MDKLTKSIFAEHLGNNFRIRVNDSTQLTVKLDEVTALSSEKEKPFSAVFSGPSDAYLAQGTYRFDNDSIGSFDLFIVPIGPDKDGGTMRYEAVFN